MKNISLTLLLTVVFFSTFLTSCKERITIYEVVEKAEENPEFIKKYKGKKIIIKDMLIESIEMNIKEESKSVDDVGKDFAQYTIKVTPYAIKDGKFVFLNDFWPTSKEIND